MSSHDEVEHLARPAAPVAPACAINIAATFTAEPLEPSLCFWMRELAIAARISFAPLYQVFQQLLDPTGLLATNQSGVNILLIRPEDWLRYITDVSDWPEVEAATERTRADLCQIVRQFTARSRVPLLIALCPASGLAQGEPRRAALLARLEADLLRELADMPDVLLLPSAELLELYPVPQYDNPYGDELGQIPYTEEFFAALGTQLARAIRALLAQPYKVIAVDCDNTLWGGVCGEDGALGVQIGVGHRALQAFLVAQQQAGMLICLCSKNSEADVQAVFDARADMLLRPEHLSLRYVNWDAKSQSLRAIAQSLGVGLDSVLFLDDSPLECAEVRAACPQVLALQVPAEPELAAFVRHLWPADRTRVTEDDRQRAARYHEQAQRERFRQETTSLGDFIDGLGLEVTIQPLEVAHLDRAAQLTQRTNQFNLTTVRRTSAELAALLREGVGAQVVHVRDRFGDYGLVGVLIYGGDGEALLVDTFLISCRTLARGVEHQMLAWLGREAQARGLAQVALPFIPTAKNLPAQRFLDGLGEVACAQVGGAARYQLPASAAAAASYSPAPHEAPAPADAEGAAPAPQGAALATWAVFQRIATQLNAVGPIMAAIRQAQADQAQAPQRYVAPHTETEQTVAAMWAELLGVERVSADAQFFDVGGHSLRLVQFMVRVRDRFGVELPMQVLISGSFTIVDAAQLIERCRIEQADEQDLEALLTQLDGLSDEEIAALLAEQG